MTKLKIILAPDKLLNKKATIVKKVDSFTKALLNDMLETMYESNGIGLAGPQVGVLKRLLVMDCFRGENKKPYKIINPEIIYESNVLNEFEEGCLSLPNFYSYVLRPEKIRVRFLSDKGKVVEKDFSGIEATCLQHEIDHLNGILFVDHISRLKRSMILKKLKKYKNKIN